jgi:hypothetical protein
MADVVDRISDNDDEEEARKRRVAYHNDLVFNPLFKALEALVSKYNERHRQDFGFPNAVLINKGPFSSRELSLRIQKTTEPQSSLTLTFPNDDGAMQIEGSLSASITLDFVNNTPTYDFNSKKHSVHSLAELLLKSLLPSDEYLDAGRRIGF